MLLYVHDQFKIASLRTKDLCLFEIWIADSGTGNFSSKVLHFRSNKLGRHQNLPQEYSFSDLVVEVEVLASLGRCLDIVAHFSTLVRTLVRLSTIKVPCPLLYSSLSKMSDYAGEASASVLAPSVIPLHRN